MSACAMPEAVLGLQRGYRPSLGFEISDLEQECVFGHVSICAI